MAQRKTVQARAVKSLVKKSKDEIPKKKKVEKAEKSLLLEKLLKASKSPWAQLMGEDEDDKFATRDWSSTGNLLFNALISGDPEKGMMSGKILQLVGRQGCGKTYMALEIAKRFQKIGYKVVIFDSEFANNDKMDLRSRGLDIENVIFIPVVTVEELTTSILNILGSIDETKGEKVFFMIDSIGNLSTTKEVNDQMSGSEKADMTRAKKLKGMFRTITINAGVKQVPMVVINHVYAGQGCGTGNMKIKFYDPDLGGIENTKFIKDVEIGDKVPTMFGKDEVIELFKYDDSEVYDITLEDGNILEFTGNHKFLIETENGVVWKKVEDLKEGEEIILY